MSQSKKQPKYSLKNLQNYARCFPVNPKHLLKLPHFGVEKIGRALVAFAVLFCLFTPQIAIAATQNISFDCAANSFQAPVVPGDLLVITLTANCKTQTSVGGYGTNVTLNSIVSSTGVAKAVAYNTTYLAGDVFTYTVGSNFSGPVVNTTANFATTTNSAQYAVNARLPNVPTITSISPASGSANGGTTVTITGTSFEVPGANSATTSVVTGVTIGGVPVQSYTVNLTGSASSATISAVTPPGTVGSASVVVTNTIGSNSANTLFTYAAPPTATANSTAAQKLTLTGAMTNITPLTGSGGTAPLTYYVSSGTLPAGISLNASTGVISGTPTAIYSTADVVIGVKDANNLPASTTATVSFTAVARPTTTSTNTTTRTLAVGLPISSFTPITGTGGTAPLTYFISSGTLPSGLTLDSTTGLVSGTPTAAYSSATVVFGVKDANNVIPVSSSTSSVPIAVNKGSQTISYTSSAPSSATIGGDTYTPIAASTSGLALTLTIDASSASVCSLSGGVVTFTGSGTCKINANQSGNADYNAAAQVQQSFTVLGRPTAVASTTAQSLTAGTAMASFTPLTGAGGSSPLTYYISSGTLPAGLSLSASTGAVTGTPTGAFASSNIVFAVKDANNSVATTTSTVSFTVNLATPVLSGFNLSSTNLVYGASAPTITAPTSASSGAITYSSSNTSVATVSGSTITIVGVGTTTLTATQAANGNFDTASSTKTLTVAAASTATLSGLALSSGTLSPTFATGTASYTAAVTNATNSITVTPTVTDSNATVKVNGTTVASGSASGVIALTVGSNTITTVVTAQDGTTTQTYTTTVTRAAASTATLSGLALSSGTLSPTFATGTGSYTAAVTNATSSITVTPTVTDSNATVKVNGTTVNSGSASGAIALTVGSNTITTVVTAQDGTTTQTYTTTVTRAALLAQANLTVTASPNALTATSSTSTLSTSGGSGTGAVSYAMTAGTCALSGSTVTAGSANETCTVTATKAADGTYLAATAIVNISVTRRASIAAAATDASVASVHSAQLLQAQKFANTQIQNITNHLDTFRHNFNLQPSNFGFSINTPSLGQLAPVFYKVKDELTFRPNDQSDVSLQKTGYRQTGYPSKQMASLTDDYNNPDLLEQQSHQEAQQGQYVREPLSYSIWTAGTIDVGTFKSGDNKETTNKFRANGLTMGLDYKLSPTAIIGGAFGFGTGQNTADTLGNKVKSTQKTLTGYGMWGFGDTWVVDGLLGYGDLAFTGDRTTSDGLNLLSMNRKGTSTFGSASISKIFRFGGFKISPFVRADLLRINLGQYNETGAADYALGYDKTSYLTTTVSTGLHFAYDAYYDSGKLTTSAKISGNRAKTGSLSQDIYFADSGAAGGIYTLQQAASFQSSTSLHLGLMYTSKGGDAIDLGWMGAVGANQYKLNGLRFGLRFAM